MTKKLKCPKCGKTQEADVFRRGGRAVAVLFSECGHGFDLKTNKEIK